MIVWISSENQEEGCRHLRFDAYLLDASTGQLLHMILTQRRGGMKSACEIFSRVM